MLIDEEYHRVTVVDNVHGILRRKVIQDRYDHSTVGESGHISHHPAYMVLAEQCHLVARFDAHGFEKHMRAGYVAGQVAVCKCFASKIF